ncbi:GreA/GreB family elongation factor [Arenibaculum pallidiluteum]|uniref:GreA/GreB family elongation factor n=1 Tax=Arenibaculum pallidiluteum TaxID=2812559 RepID=UPI001A973301|nr:GreA/GreB family elongation factor [Arenibaculum pallidiluteum]
MSRAFVRESDGEEEDRSHPAAPTGPIRVTPATLQTWRDELRTQEEAVQRLRDSDAPEDRLELSQARRRAGLLRARIDAAVVADEPPHDPDEAGFGSVLVLEDETGRRWRFTLVGGEEADPAAGRISWRSPLGQALLGARPGDPVSWARQGGTLELTVVAVEQPAAP